MDAKERGRADNPAGENARHEKSALENVLVALGCPHKLIVLPTGQFVLSFIEPPLV